MIGEVAARLDAHARHVVGIKVQFDQDRAFALCKGVERSFEFVLRAHLDTISAK